MTARATIKRGGVPTTDADGFEVTGWGVIRADVPCWVDSSGQGTSGSRSRSVGGVEVQVATRLLKIPHYVTGLSDDDVVYISGGACDGRYFRIVEATLADQKKQQALPVIEVGKPDGWGA